MLAVANIGKNVGTCTNTPTYDSLGGSRFEIGCSDGVSGRPAY
ncbi:hypothetical protein [Kitasatospora sp. GP82]|nr:hypothetical protein [Kitasatospora sp. GP82]MDH6128062.1 hypothetical protein [Kitasatospora sp. GP82]